MFEWEETAPSSSYLGVAAGVVGVDGAGGGLLVLLLVLAGDAPEGVDEEGLVAGVVLAVLVLGAGLGFGVGFGGGGGGALFLVPDSFLLGDSHKGVDEEGLVVYDELAPVVVDDPGLVSRWV